MTGYAPAFRQPEEIRATDMHRTCAVSSPRMHGMDGKTATCTEVTVYLVSSFSTSAAWCSYWLRMRVYPCGGGPDAVQMAVEGGSKVIEIVELAGKTVQ